MKKIISLLLLVIFLCSGCVGSNDYSTGDHMNEITNKHAPYITLNALSAYEIDGNYLIVVADSDIVEKLAEFSSDRKCKRAQNLKPIKDVDITQFINMNFEEIKKMLGQPHADIGSGAYIPTYITEKANLISFHIENDIAYEVIKRDLITDEIICQAENFSSDFIPDDSKSIADSLTKEYSIKELKDFFGQTSANERLLFDGKDNDKSLTIIDVNEKFPIEILRKNGYTVYKVKEGGYFYVFWWSAYDFSDHKFLSDASVYFTAHLTSLKKAEDFDSLKIGVSTAQDVAEIDPAMELNFLMSSITPSYSLLEDGRIIEICYSLKDNATSRSDMIVEKMEILSKDNSPSKLAVILQKDLP